MNRRRRRAEARLARLAETPVDGPRPGFSVTLERRLIGAASVAAGATLVALPTRHRSLLPILTVGAATVATAVLAGALFGVIGQGGSGALHLAAAVDTTVVMPGGHAVAGHSGLNLPNGAVVWTGPQGNALAGTVEMGPGIEAVVDSGTLKLSPLPGPSTVGTGSVPVATPAARPFLPPVAALPTVTTTTTPRRTPPTTRPVTTTTTAPKGHLPNPIRHP